MKPPVCNDICQLEVWLGMVGSCLLSSLCFHVAAAHIDEWLLVRGYNPAAYKAANHPPERLHLDLMVGLIGNPTFKY